MQWSFHEANTGRGRMAFRMVIPIWMKCAG